MIDEPAITLMGVIEYFQLFINYCQLVLSTVQMDGIDNNKSFCNELKHFDSIRKVRYTLSVEFNLKFFNTLEACAKAFWKNSLMRNKSFPLENPIKL